MTTIRAKPLTAAAFAAFGDVLEAEGPPDRLINAGLCGRWHDRARLDFGPGGRAGLSIFRSEARVLPYQLTLLERHPLGSQAFIPMAAEPFLVVVAEGAGEGAAEGAGGGAGGAPGAIHAFVTAPGQGINLLRGTWHGVLTPLDKPGTFAVIDRIGPEANLQEYPLARPVTIL